MTSVAPDLPRVRPGTPKPDDVRAQLRRMFRHRAFSRSARLRRFLEFVVETALDGRAHELKEFTVAVNAFDKDESFDPRIDPIVRVEAGRLRQRIDEYYQDHPEDRILVRLRKRGYRPVMRWMKPSDRVNGAVSKSTIAVLDFDDLTPDKHHAHIAKVIPERIATLLPQMTALRPTGTVGKFRADYLLKGSVQHTSRRIRVMASVLRQADGAQVWSDTFDRRLTDDIFDLQDELAAAIASRLRVS